MSRTKGDLINSAFDLLRLRGVTLVPSSDDNKLAVRRLENMMTEFFGRDIDVGYYFEENPDSASNHNVPSKFWFALETNLAVRLIPDFGKIPDPALVAQANAGLSYLHSSTTVFPVSQNPQRMPRGSGNTQGLISVQNKYFVPAEIPPIAASTIRMYIGDILDLEESFEDVVNTVAGESIASYVITYDTGIVLVSDSLASNIISYRIQADGDNTTGTLYKLKIVATTSTGQVITRIKDFEFMESDI